jgi:predicted ester cyclase
MTNVDLNKAIFRRVLELMDKQDFAGARALFTPDFRAHPTGQTIPADAYEQMIRMFYAAFPDGVHEIEALIGEGDLISARVTFSGTHRGDFMGIPPSGKRASCSGMMFARMTGQKVAEMWGELDQMFMQHSGIVAG